MGFRGYGWGSRQYTEGQNGIGGAREPYLGQWRHYWDLRWQGRGATTGGNHWEEGKRVGKLGHRGNEVGESGKKHEREAMQVLMRSCRVLLVRAKARGRVWRGSRAARRGGKKGDWAIHTKRRERKKKERKRERKKERRKRNGERERDR